MSQSAFGGDFLATLRSRNFSFFTVAQTISQFGEKLHHIVLISMVGIYAQGSPAILARLGVTFTLPSIVFGPAIGTVVDRWNRKLILVTSEGCRSAIVALIPLLILSQGKFALLYPLVFTVFLCGVFFNTSKLAVIPSLVPREKLLAANSISLFSIRVATILGMVLGGYLVDWPAWRRFNIAGWQAGLGINAILFLLSATLMRRLPLTPSSPDMRRDQPFLSHLKAAFGLVRTDRLIRFVMVSAFLFCLIGATIYVLVVSLVQHELGRGTAGVGLMAATLGVGTLVGAVFYSSVGQRLSRTIVIAVCLGLVGMLLVLFSMVSSTSKLMFISFLGGIFLAPIPIAQDTLLHEHLSENERGRIFGIRDWIVNLFFATGSLILGFLSSAMTIDEALVYMGVAIGVGATMLLSVWTKWGREKSAWV